MESGILTARDQIDTIAMSSLCERRYTSSWSGVKRYIRAVYTPVVGVPWSNQELFHAIQASLEPWLGAEERTPLLDLIRLFLIGSRTRNVQCPDFLSFDSFEDHARAFESAAADSLKAVAAETEKNGPAQFDAIIAVSSTGLPMPGLADQAANFVRDRVNRHALLLDVANAGCTGSSRALQLGANLGPEVRDILIVVVEPTSTLADPRSLERPNWQGVCTFGDGAAGIWLSCEPGAEAAQLNKIVSWHGNEPDLIRWEKGSNYYRFGLTDPESFETRVRREILEATTQIGWNKNGGALCAIHPAGIMLLLSLAKKLELDRAILEPSIRHFRTFSNMSSASILHILRELLVSARAGQEVRWLTMGTGFHVVYGLCTKL
jgi:alkylresorcinol/alkylpyrone synthase